MRGSVKLLNARFPLVNKHNGNAIYFRDDFGRQQRLSWAILASSPHQLRISITFHPVAAAPSNAVHRSLFLILKYLQRAEQQQLYQTIMQLVMPSLLSA